MGNLRAGQFRDHFRKIDQAMRLRHLIEDAPDNALM